MALAYPEGEVFFKRDPLYLEKRDNGGHWIWNPSTSRDFYSHIMVEYVWNVTELWVENKFRHPRTGYTWTHAASSAWTYYGAHELMNVSYGPYQNPARREYFNLPIDASEFRNTMYYDAAKKSYIVPLLMPSSSERYLWFDMVKPIRAIYFPLCHKTDEAHQNLGTYIQVNFTQRNGAQIWRPDGNKFAWHPFDSQLGLGRYDNYSVGIDTKELYDLLSLPRQLRNTNIYTSKAIQLLPATTVRTASHAVYRPKWQHDFATIASANFGVDLTWAPYEYTSFILNLVTSLVEAGLGLIPGAGAILSASFSLGLTILTDPEKFKSDARNANWDLSLITAVIESAAGSKKKMPAGFQRKGRMGTRSLPEGGEKAAAEGEKEDIYRDATDPQALEEAEKEMETAGPNPYFAEALKILAGLDRDGNPIPTDPNTRSKIGLLPEGEEKYSPENPPPYENLPLPKEGEAPPKR